MRYESNICDENIALYRCTVVSSEPSFNVTERLPGCEANCNASHKTLIENSTI